MTIEQVDALKSGDKIVALDSCGDTITKGGEYVYIGKRPESDNYIVFVNDDDELDAWGCEHFDPIVELNFNIENFATSTKSVFTPMSTKEDVVNHPKHYKECSLESIELMELVFGEQAVADFCLCSAYKYLHRHLHKGKPREDLQKARWYLNKVDEFDIYKVDYDGNILNNMQDLIDRKLKELDNE